MPWKLQSGDRLSERVALDCDGSGEAACNGEDVTLAADALPTILNFVFVLSARAGSISAVKARPPVRRR